MMGNKARRKERETERERFGGREREKHSSERKQCGLISTAGLNQQCLLMLNTWEFINSNNRWIICQSTFWVVFCIPRLIWLYSIRLTNTKSTPKVIHSYNFLHFFKIFRFVHIFSAAAPYKDKLKLCKIVLQWNSTSLHNTNISL